MRLASGSTPAHPHAEGEKIGKPQYLRKPFCHGITAFTLSPEFSPASARKYNFGVEPSSAAYSEWL
jgi:hypothetical protein